MSAIATSALAQSRGEQATAEVLFQQARDLLAEGKPDEACPKFAESYQLDPGLGTLLGLALCHEQQGKLATAWVEFTEAAALAQRQNQTERRDFARERVETLKPRLSQLTIEVPADVASTPGIQITRDGTPLGPSAWALATPVDGGEVVIEAKAPAKADWSRTVTIAPEGARITVVVPQLADLPPEAAAGHPSDPTHDAGPRHSTFDPSGFSSMQWVGVGSVGAGLVSAGVGTYFLLGALADKKASNSEGCVGNACPDGARDLRSDAVAKGNLATLFGAGAAVLVGTGVTLFFVGAEDTPPERGQLDVRWAGGSDWSVEWRGAF